MRAACCARREAGDIGEIRGDIGLLREARGGAAHLRQLGGEGLEAAERGHPADELLDEGRVHVQPRLHAQGWAWGKGSGMVRLGLGG